MLPAQPSRLPADKGMSQGIRDVVFLFLPLVGRGICSQQRNLEEEDEPEIAGKSVLCPRPLSACLVPTALGIAVFAHFIHSSWAFNIDTAWLSKLS